MAGKKAVYYILVNPRDENVAVCPAFGPGYSEIDRNYPTATLQEMMRIYRPTAVINGTFFDSRSHRTVCNVVLGTKLVCEGDRGSTLLLGEDGTPELILTSRLRGRNIDWSRARWAIQSGPTLLYNGQVVLNPASEGFRDPSLFRTTRRTAAGITRDGRLIFAVTSGGVSLKEMARIMRSLGAVHALNLDGGSSSGMAFRNTIPVKPGRSLANFILIYENKKVGRLPDYPSIRLLIKGREKMLAERYLKTADGFRQSGRMGPALKYYYKACKTIPYDCSLAMATAQALEMGGRNALASKFFGKAAMNALEAGDPRKAQSLADRAMELNPGNNYAKEVSRLLRDFPEFTDAVKRLREKDFLGSFFIVMDMIRKDSRNPRFYFLLARVFAAMERHDLKARAFYLSSLYFRDMPDRNYEAYLSAKLAVESSPGDSTYRMLLSNAAARIGDWKTAGYHRFIEPHLRGREKSGQKVSRDGSGQPPAR
jgi:tetratricopeptide (TPR) repeat protein